MPIWLRWTLAILILVILLVTFIVSFILYRKTPVPKGCEDLEASEEKCASCKVEGCSLNLYRQKKKENESHDC